ncbi:hypothetical protein [Leptospira kanakyensis]|uniref:hypothetical protein n=1 Tax=Leptospira kanakyensis TaxID=2484968 RepID=UPI00223DAD1D|nr:hypothetical protein [Leptospira kanakyensis]MCW7468647.1 hypothetical protein [Leptospira kanakyensis]
MKHFSPILRKPILIGFVFLFSSTNCYFNPLVNDLLNPKVEESDSSALLGLAGGSASTVSITGQIKKLGVSLVGVEVSLGTTSFSSKNTNSSTTNTAGRFYLNIPTGPATLQFSDGGTLVTIQLMVTPMGATVGFINNSSYSVQSLDVYVLGEEPVYLELTSSMPYDGLLVDNSNYGTTINGNLVFKFSEFLEMPSNSALWTAENIIVNPSIGFEYTSISKDNVTIVLAGGSLPPFTPFTITLNSSIKSETGKSIRPTTIRFMTGEF